MTKKDRGLVMVYTGNGKGKTTSVIGLAVRAVGQGLRVLMVQFMKGSDYGEDAGIRYLPGFEVMKAGRDRFVDAADPDPEDVELARQGFDAAEKALMGEECHMVILDEINVALEFNLIPLEEVLRLIENKPPNKHLVLTGRNALPDVVDRADMVSEVREVKHHYSRGIAAQKGIEF